MNLTCTNEEILQVLDVQTLPFGNPHSILYAPNGKLFIGSQTVPSVYVLNDPKSSLSGGTTISVPDYFGNGAGNTTDTTYNYSNNKIYGTSYWKPYSINPDNLNITFNDPQASQNLFADGNSCVTNDGNNLYLGLSNLSIRKINLTTNEQYDFDTYNYRIQNPDISEVGGIWRPHAMKMSQDNQYLLVSVFNPDGCGGGLLLKIRLSDNTISHINFSSVGPMPTDDIVVFGDYVYVGSERRGNPPGCPYLNEQGFSQGIKINWKTMQVERIIPLSNAACYTVATDHEYIYFGTADNKIIAYNPNTNEVKTLSITLPVSNLNELIYVGDNTWIGTTYQSSNARIFKLYMNSFCEWNKYKLYRKKIISRLQINTKIRRVRL